MDDLSADEHIVLAQIDDDMLTECQGKLQVALEENRNLKIALQSARRIGGAIGILMATRRVTDDEAFELLVDASKRRNTKLREIAEDVLLTGTL